MKISFLVTCKNEGVQLFKLLYILNDYIKNTDDEIVILDDYSDDTKTVEALTYFSLIRNNFIHFHKLEKNYSQHKNYGNSKCTGDYIFAIDADEYPNQQLLVNIREIIEANPGVDLFALPRVNIVHGITPQAIQMYNWHVTKIEGFEHVPTINFPDFQSRLYKKAEHIIWDRKLHEHIIGCNVVTKFPPLPELSLIHEKTLERQLKQNEFYNSQFTMEDNVRVY
jgi:glycosyltransferase involved in cell wall biosynthesis